MNKYKKTTFWKQLEAIAWGYEALNENLKSPDNTFLISNFKMMLDGNSVDLNSFVDPKRSPFIDPLGILPMSIDSPPKPQLGQKPQLPQKTHAKKLPVKTNPVKILAVNQVRPAFVTQANPCKKSSITILGKKVQLVQIIGDFLSPHQRFQERRPEGHNWKVH